MSTKLVAFDALMLDGKDLRALPLVQRKGMLGASAPWHGAPHVPGSRSRSRHRPGRLRAGPGGHRREEGIVAKRRGGAYDPNATVWWKVKNVNYHQARDRWELFDRRRAGAPMMNVRKRLLAILSDVAPDLAVALWNDRDIRELPRHIREAICAALGHEAARRGLDANEKPNAYGRELDALVKALGLDE
jgi:hypothetical protein